MKITSTLKNHLRQLDSDTFDILQQVTRMSKDLYNSTLYIQRQHFFENKKIHSLKDLFQLVKKTPQYLCLPSDLAQQVLILVNQNFRPFFALLKKKKAVDYSPRVHLPNYLEKEGYHLLTFISRLFRVENGQTRLSLGFRGETSTGTRFLYVPSPPLGIEPKQIRVIPKYHALSFEIEYIYEVETKPFPDTRPDSFLSIDLGLDNFATCTTTSETAFIIEGRGLKSYNRWWNKCKSKIQSNLDKIGSKMNGKMARFQRYRHDVIDNFFNHAVLYLVNHCLEHYIGTIIVGEWADMKRGLKMAKKVSQLFQTIPYRKFKQKLEHKALLHGIKTVFVEESYTSQACFRCGLRWKANRIHRGLYRCRSCGGELNADINAALNIMKQVVPNSVMTGREWNSGDIISPSRIRLVEFV